VTVGVDELLVGADEELPEDEDELDEKELPPETVEVAAPDPELDGTVAVVPPLFPLDPAWSWDTTTPMATVAPVAARTAPRVRLRSRARAVSLLLGVGG